MAAGISARRYRKARRRLNGCPVYEATGAALCRHTPYIPWSEAEYATGTSSEEAKDAAEAEYLFLEGLHAIEVHRRMGL